MKKTIVMFLLLLVCTIWLLAGCTEDDDDSSSDGDTSADTDTDTDSDSDTDTDSDTDADDECGSCHGYPPETGKHLQHTFYGCETCHRNVVDRDNNVLDQAAHDDSEPDIEMSGFYDAGVQTCTLSCHHTEPMEWN